MAQKTKSVRIFFEDGRWRLHVEEERHQINIPLRADDVTEAHAAAERFLNSWNPAWQDDLKELTLADKDSKGLLEFTKKCTDHPVGCAEDLE